MPRITAKTNVFLNREKKYRMTLEFKEAIELIPCEKGSFVMMVKKKDLLQFSSISSTKAASVSPANSYLIPHSHQL